MLVEAAQNSGVLSRNFGVFQNAGYVGLYTLNVDGIRERKGIDPKEDVLDVMGRRELAANEFRITQTEGKLIEQGNIGETRAIETHFQVGREVRHAIERIGGQMPEDLPPEPSIKRLLDHRRRAKKKLKAKTEANEQDEPAQERLF